MNNIGRVERSKGKFLQALGSALINLDDLVLSLSLDNSLTEEAETQLNAFLKAAENIIHYLNDDEPTETL